jgi:hypothetical protein
VAAAKGTKVQISNLPTDISEADVRDLFGSTAELLGVRILTNRAGLSLGKAEVVFAQQSKAKEAVATFHGRTLDGVPMTVVLAPLAEPAAAVAIPNPKAEMFGSALGGGAAPTGKGKPTGKGAGKGAGGAGGRDPTFSIRLDVGLLKAAGKSAAMGKGAGKAKPAAPAPAPARAKQGAKGKGAANPGNLDDDMDSYFAAAKGKAAPAKAAAPKAAKAPKAPPADAAALDDDMAAYFAARPAA